MRDLSDEFLVCHTVQGKKTFPTIALLSNKDAADEKHYPYNHVPVHYNVVSNRL